LSRTDSGTDEKAGGLGGGAQRDGLGGRGEQHVEADQTDTNHAQEERAGQHWTHGT
jgi:hypothetical protein